MRPGCGLKRDLGQAGDLGQIDAEVEQQLQDALHVFDRLIRMQMSQTRQGRRSLVDLRIVFHRARAERIEVPVDAEQPPGQPGEVANQIQLADLRQIGGLAGQEFSRDDRRSIHGLDVQLRQADRTGSGNGLLEQKRLAIRRPARQVRIGWCHCVAHAFRA